MRATTVRPALLSVLLAFLLAPAAALAQPRGAPTLPAVRRAAPIALDGRLDDPAWAAAPVAGDFVQRRPAPGRPATQRTEARVLVDDASLWVALRLHDAAPDSVVATLARRDFGGHSDWVHVLVDGYRDRRTAFRFSVNPAGVVADAMVVADEDDAEQIGWDAVWDAAVARDSAGWSAELRIPLSQLRFADADSGGAWGIQFVRDVARSGERSLWSPAAPTEPGWVSRFGTLTGLGVRARRRLETIPYVLGRVSRAPGAAASPFRDATELAPDVGADVRLGLGSDMTLAATVNPDFGEVEADPSEVNLTAQETFLAERRPFFLEGMDIFQLELAEAPWIHGSEQLFHSRRIGRGVQGAAPDDARHVDADAVSRILAAAKLSGKLRGTWSLGLLSATTGAERARWLDDASVERGGTIEPLTHFALARATRLARDGDAAVGGVLTATHRRLTDDFRLLPASAWVGGVDGRLRFGGGDWDLTGSLLGSRLAGDADAIAAVKRNPVHRHQRPDAAHLDPDPDATAMRGWSAMASIAKNAGRWRGTLAAHAVSPGFDANDLGFHTASDFRRVHTLLGYQQNEPAHFRRWWWWLNSWSTWTTGGEHVALGSQLNGNVELRNLWLVNASVRRDQPALSPSWARGGPAVRTPGRTRVNLTVATDTRRTVGATVAGSVTQGDEGERAWRVAPMLRVRPSARADLSLQPSVQVARDPVQWIGRVGGGDAPAYLAGDLRQTTTALTARLDVAFTRSLSLSVFAQPFLSEGRYDAVRRLAEPRAGDLARRFATLGEAAVERGAERWALDLDADGAADATIGNPAFDVAELKSNVVLRWQLRPGSTISAIWGQGRAAREPLTGEEDDGLAADVRDLWRLPATDVLLVKWSWWIGR